MILHTLLLMLISTTLSQYQVTTASSDDDTHTVITPIIDAPGNLQLLEEEQIRCEAQNGDFCLFYKDLSEAPFRGVEYRKQAKVCLLFISGEELLEEISLQSETEVFLSCAILLNSTDGTHLSQRSEIKKVVVTDPFAVRITTEKFKISAEQSSRVRCEALRGTQCNFYTDQSEIPVRTEMFRSRACMVFLTGKEILAKSVHQKEVTEVELSCDVELKKDNNKVISSVRSKGVKVTVFGEEDIKTQLITSVTETVFTSEFGANVKINNDEDSGFLIWSMTGGLLILMVMGVLIMLYLKHKRKDIKNNRTQQDTHVVPIYSTVTEIQTQNDMQEQDTEGDIYYAAVVHSKPSKPKITPETVYSTVVHSKPSKPNITPEANYSTVVHCKPRKPRLTPEASDTTGVYS